VQGCLQRAWRNENRMIERQFKRIRAGIDCANGSVTCAATQPNVQFRAVARAQIAVPCRTRSPSPSQTR
jgi:hypothetical protein